MTQTEVKKELTAVGTLNSEKLGKLLDAGAPELSRTPLGACNLRGLIAFEHLRRFIGLAARAIPYPDIGRNFNTVQIKKTGDPAFVEAKSTLVYGTKIRQDDGETATVFGGPQPDLYKDYYYLESPPIGIAPFHRSTSDPWGRAEENTMQNGLLFPYFDGLLAHDQDYLLSAIQDDFFNCLGDNAAASLETLNALRPGISSLSKTREGTALCHAMWGLRNALRVGAGIFYVTSEETYSGFILCGTHWQAIDGNSMIEPVDKKELELDYSVFNTAKQRFEKIRDELSAIEVSSTGAAVQCPVLTSKMQVINEVRRRDKAAVVASNISVLFHELPKSDYFWDWTGKNISEAIDIFLGGEYSTEIPTSTEIKIENVYNQYYYGLLPFGDTAPSMISFKKEATKYAVSGETQLVDLDPAKGLLPGLPRFPKPLTICAAEWERVFVSGFLTASKAKKGISSSSGLIQGQEAVDLASKIKTAQAVLGKRKAGAVSAQKRGKSESRGPSEEPSTKKTLKLDF